jgi:hypothetical protein
MQTGRMVTGAIRIVAVLAMAFTTVSSCQWADDLGDARQRWESADVDSYRWTVELSCFCVELPGAVRITVVDGVAVATSVPVDDGYPKTVEDLFDLIEANLKADDLQVTYHPDDGYPVSVTIDRFADAVDDELFYGTSDFQPG